MWSWQAGNECRCGLDGRGRAPFKAAVKEALYFAGIAASLGVLGCTENGERFVLSALSVCGGGN